MREHKLEVGEHKSFTPVWRCIYCGEEDRAKLTKEHIIPYGLGGSLILPKSSCFECNKITKAIEETCLRKIYGPIRVRLGVQTRHPEQRPLLLKVPLRMPDGLIREVSVPAAEYPPHLWNVALEWPGILQGANPSAFFRFSVYLRGQLWEIDNLVKQYGAIGIAGPNKWDALNFMRMLAKIGHAFAVAELGLDSFEHLAVPIIRGTDRNIPYLVGGELAQPEPHDRQSNIVKWVLYKSTRLLVVQIRLLASFGTPQYYVVVGRWKGNPNQVTVRK